MAITKTEKQERVGTIREILDKAQSVVFVAFNRLMVSEVSELRKKLRENKGGYMVVKKSLLKRVLGEKTLEGDLPELAGEVAIAYGDDAVLPAKQIADFRKGNQDKINILGGIFEGKYMDAIAMNELAAIPPRETLLGMFANVINSPISGLVIALDAIAKKKA